jgi:hypothetical protein
MWDFPEPAGTEITAMLKSIWRNTAGSGLYRPSLGGQGTVEAQLGRYRRLAD